MSLPSNYLDAFYTCSQLGHFTKAAEKLNITQSALSQRVANLESELETSLFIRDRSGLRLTPAGEELLRYCAAKDSLEKESLSRIKSGKDRNEISGYIRIGGFSSVMRSVVLPALSPLMTNNAHLQLTFVSKEMDELPHLFRRGEIDYMVLYDEIIRDSVETLFLGNEIDVLTEKKGYRGPDIYLDHDENDQTTSKYFRLKGIKKKIHRRYLDDVYGLIDGVKNGLGRAILPVHLIRKEKDLKIVDRKTAIKFPVFLHYHRQPFYTHLHNEIVSHLKLHCSKFLGDFPK